MSLDIDHTKNVSHQCGFFMTFKITIACDQCDCKLKWKGDLKKHKESVHGDVWYYCDQCEYQATQKGNLKTHIDSVHGDVRYTCYQCDCK